MDTTRTSALDSSTYLANAGLGRRLLRLKSKQIIFAQGTHAETIYYLRQGRAKLTVVSSRGKEATISFLVPGDFVGEEAIVSAVERRKATAICLTGCVVLRIERVEMLRALREEMGFSNLFLQFMLLRGMRTQADLVDQLFNSSERRLARTLLLMAEFGTPNEPVTLIPSVTQETLAEMIGTTRSRVSFFMNRFRKLGYIDYKRRIRVDKSLMHALLHDDLQGLHAAKPPLEESPRDSDRLEPRKAPRKKTKISLRSGDNP